MSHDSTETISYKARRGKERIGETKNGSRTRDWL